MKGIMTPTEWIAKFPQAMEALCKGEAAVMPIINDVLVHGPNESFYKGPREEPIQRVNGRLWQRLDKQGLT